MSKSKKTKRKTYATQQNQSKPQISQEEVTREETGAGNQSTNSTNQQNQNYKQQTKQRGS